MSDLPDDPRVGRPHGGPPEPAAVRPGDWADLAARRTRELPGDVRNVLAGLYWLVAGDRSAAERGLAAAMADGVRPRVLGRAVEVLVAALGLPVWTRAAWTLVPAPDSGPEAAPAAGVAGVDAHYAAGGDTTPPPITRLAERHPELAAMFVATRATVAGPAAALAPATRELLLGLLSAQAGYLDGARRHLDRARAAGTTDQEIAEALTCAVLTHGADAWESYGRALWPAGGV